MALSKEKVLDLVKKLFAQAESEESLGNSGAAINFAQKAQKLLSDYKLENPIIVSIEDSVIGKTIVVFPFYRVNARSKERIVWFENLAKVVAKANSCKVEIPYFDSYRNNGTEVIFEGTDIERMVCVYVFESLAKMAFNSCKFNLTETKKTVGEDSFTDFKTGKTYDYLKVWPGNEAFVEKFMVGFISGIEEAFNLKKAIGSGNGDSGELNSDLILDGSSNLIISLGRKSAHATNSSLVSKTTTEIKTKVETEIKTRIGDVMYAVDCSGSMSGGYPKDKLEQAKNGVLDAARSLIENGYFVGLVRFESYADLLVSPTNDFKQFERAVTELTIGGSTNMAEGIRQSMYRFLNNYIRRTICVVTDGFPDSSSKALELAEQAKSTGIEITAIGTEDADHDFLKKLCSKPKLALSCGSSQLESGIKEMTKMLVA